MIIKHKTNRHYSNLFQERSSLNASSSSSSSPSSLSSSSSSNDIDQWINENQLNDYSRLIKEMYHTGQSTVTFNNKITFLDSSSKFNTVYNALENAKNHIHVEYFVFHDDQAGKPALNTMRKKVSEEQVTVRMTVDGMGTMNPLSRRKIRKSGIQYKTFFPVDKLSKYLLPKYFQHRMHRKIIVIDGKVGFMGGLNMSNMYIEGVNPYPHWRDTHLCIEGDGVQDLQAIFLDDWEYVSGKEIDIDSNTYYPDSSDIMNHSIVSHPVDNTNKTFDKIPMQIVPAGPDSQWRLAHHMLHGAFSSAQEYILITTPYFTPDKALLTALKSAALSGVDVHIIMQGKPENPPVKMAACGYHDELIECGIKVYEYWSGIIHAKTFVIDGRIGIVTSCNLDYRG
jgi:cardiolipin synthase